ncbi:hypothetical protein F9856_09715 [Streptococcus suis]|uniref:hypothetical protein n=1 Tax=Streptococcus suis TaxID=1307 RepID=UPI0019214A3B|nr:hypothetical protein [Streptococcus suis]MBL1126399.1 hypothetical protein [Streptococcus suis]
MAKKLPTIRHHETNQKQTQTNNNLFVGLGLLGGISILSGQAHFLFPILVLSALAYGTFFLIHRNTAKSTKNTALRLQNLKESISHIEQELKQLNNYLKSKNYSQYALLALELLPQLTMIREETSELKYQLDTDISSAIIQQTIQEEEKILKQLKLLDLIAPSSFILEETKKILSIAPELATTYQNVQNDHIEILEQLKNLENAEELRVIHEINMKHYNDILGGYLKIKENPKNFYSAEERLAQSKLALEKFDADLDETLRKFNERQLNEFEISLRMMGKDANGEDLLAEKY